jgi:hypothetical protein
MMNLRRQETGKRVPLAILQGGLSNRTSFERNAPLFTDFPLQSVKIRVEGRFAKPLDFNR